MLAYRHAFHAGNHADVLKHLVLAQVLVHMAAKDKPFTLVDTHAGAGGYSLEGRYARQNAESDSGIARLWSRADLPAALAHYVGLVRRFNGAETVLDRTALAQYPGSPAIAQMLLRPADPLHATSRTPPTSASWWPTSARASTPASSWPTASRRCRTSCRRPRAAVWC